MKLINSEAEYFNDLYTRFLIHSNKKLNIIKKLDSSKDLLKTDPLKQMNLRAAIYEDMNNYINSFLEQASLSDKEIEDVKSWRLFVRSKFFVYRHLKNHTIFVDLEDNAKVYGVLGLIDGIDKLLPTHILPIVIEATLLPFGNKIIYDGMFGASDFKDPNMANFLKDYILEYKKTKPVITALPEKNSVSQPTDWEGDETPYEINQKETFVRDQPKLGRNDPCSCGSGKKYKKCCGK